MILVLALLLSAIPEDIARLQQASSVAGERICAGHALQQFYTRRASQPAWDQRNLGALVTAIDRSGEDGLEPSHYHRKNAVSAGTERTVKLTTPVPVYVLYWTAWVGDDGHVEFHRDHYERDAAVAAAMNCVTGATSGRGTTITGQDA